LGQYAQYRFHIGGDFRHELLGNRKAPVIPLLLISMLAAAWTLVAAFDANIFEL